MFHIEPLKLWVHKVLPVVYDDSLSYYEVLAKVTKKLNEVIDLTDEQTQYIETFTGNLTEAIQNWETGIESEWSNYKRDLNTEWQSFITSTEQYLKNWTSMQESEIEDAIAAGITQFETYFADLTQTAVDAAAAAEAAAETAAEDAVEAVLPTLEDTFDERYAWRTAVGSPLVASTAAGMTDTDKIYVYVGSETGYVSGDWYYYDGTAWQDGGVYNSAAIVTDPTLSESGMPADAKATGDEITDLKSAISDQLTEITVDKGTLTPNEYIKYDTGEFVPFNGWSRTGYLPCDKYTQLKLSRSSIYCAFYDSEEGYLQRATFVADTYLDVPENAAYVAISEASNTMSTIVINAMAKGLEYIFNEKIENIDNIIITEKTESASSLIDGYLISGTGEQTASEAWVCTDYINMPFDVNSGYAIRGTFYGIGGCAIYDINNEMLLAINGNNITSYGGTAISGLQTINIDGVPGAKKIRISGYKTSTASASDLWVKGNTFNGVYEHLYDAEKDITEIKANISTTIASSKVLVIGDSISTDSYGSYKKWVTDLIEENFLPSDTTNSSQHATGFVARYNNQPNDFITRLKAVENPSQYDLVIVFGGINDYIQNIPMGEETGTDYTVSFKPAVNEFFNYMIQNFTQARLCVLLPLRNYQNWENSVGEYQQAYGDYIKTVAKKYCLPVLNLTDDSGFCPYIATFSNMWTLQPEGYQSHDGVHPNEEYERRFLAPMIKHFLQGLL